LRSTYQQLQSIKLRLSARRFRSNGTVRGAVTRRSAVSPHYAACHWVWSLDNTVHRQLLFALRDFSTESVRSAKASEESEHCVLPRPPRPCVAVPTVSALTLPGAARRRTSEWNV
jgi:hypothetical protein